MLIKNGSAVWSSVLLACATQLLTFSVAHADEPENTNILEVPIRLLSFDKNGEQLQLWIEGERLNGCDLPLELVQHTEVTETGLTEIRIQVFHTVAADSVCSGEYVPFTVPFNVQQPIEAGQTYQIFVNDYHVTLEN